MAHTYSNQDLVLVAIDVSKRFFDVLVQWPSGKNRLFKVPNSKEGHQELVSFLCSQERSVIAAQQKSAEYSDLAALLPTYLLHPQRQQQFPHNWYLRKRHALTQFVAISRQRLLELRYEPHGHGHAKLLHKEVTGSSAREG